MSPTLAALEQQREKVLEEMRSIDRLRRGSLSRHFLQKHQGGQTLTHGPYFVLQGYLRGKKFSQHIRGEEATQVGQEVKNYQRFQALADRFVTVTDQITQRSSANAESKKNSSRRKSPPNGSARPKPS